jgi:DegV family protein with EDD domain
MADPGPADRPERRIAIVTDSTASLTPEAVAEHAITVVPVQVIIGATSYDDGMATPAMVADALEHWTPVSTSRPNPSTFVEAYEKAVAAGATEIISLHISADLSGTFDSAKIAAKELKAQGVKVTVVDTRQTAFALGYAALAAAHVVENGGSTRKAVTAARARADASASLFYVDTLEYLRRGGRVTAVAAILGGALAVKPLLRLSGGRIESFEKVRTAGKALARLEELAVTHATNTLEGAPVTVTVGHLASPDRARALADKLAARLDVAGDIEVAELGAVLGAHVGPGMVAVAIAPAIS